jgi:hypothetical protein
VLCKDRVFETFRSLYTQRPSQSSVLRRSLGFNAEVSEHARISRITSRDHKMLGREGMIERIPRFSAHIVIKSPTTDPDSLQYNYKGRNSYFFFDLTVYVLFYSFFKTLEHGLVVRRMAVA